MVKYVHKICRDGADGGAARVSSSSLPAPRSCCWWLPNCQLKGKFTIFHDEFHDEFQDEFHDEHRWTNWVPKCSKSSGPGGLLPCTTSHLGVLAWWERTCWSPHVKPRSKSVIAQITRKPEPRGLEISPMCSPEPGQPFAKPVLERIQRYPNTEIRSPTRSHAAHEEPRKISNLTPPSSMSTLCTILPSHGRNTNSNTFKYIQIHSNAVYSYYIMRVLQ